MKKRISLIVSLVCAFGLMLTAFFYTGAQAAPRKHYLSNTPYPSVIRVAIRENNQWGQPDTRGRILYVRYYRFDDYMRNVLPNEWLPSWDRNAIQAGAIAIKMFGWYHVLNPIKQGGFTFDVDNTVNFQVFKERSNQPATDDVIAQMRPTAYVKRDGEIFELNYRAGYKGSANAQYRNAQKMAQWGCQYWATKGKTYLQILQYYYEGRVLTRIPNL